MNKRNIIERFDYARRIGDFKSAHAVIVSDDVEVKNTPQDTLLSIVYAPDDRTGLPTGDLQYYVSDRASDDVKKFILDNLMSDVSAAKNIANPSGLSDDALIELSRGSNESVTEYINRLGQQIDNFKFIKEQIAKQNVPDKSE